MNRTAAAGELLMRGELSEILALEDEETQQAANPVRDGKIVLPRAAIAARQEAMVARLLASDDSVSVIVLGAAHDLRTRLDGRGVEYRRIATGRVEQLLK